MAKQRGLSEPARRRGMLLVLIFLAMFAYGLLMASRSPAAHIALHVLHSYAANGGVRQRAPGQQSAQMKALMSRHAGVTFLPPPRGRELRPLRRHAAHLGTDHQLMRTPDPKRGRQSALAPLLPGTQMLAGTAPRQCMWNPLGQLQQLLGRHRGIYNKGAAARAGRPLGGAPILEAAKLRQELPAMMTREGHSRPIRFCSNGTAWARGTSPLRIVMLGDSTMARLAQHTKDIFLPGLSCPNVAGRSRSAAEHARIAHVSTSRCDRMEYLGVPRPDTWTPPPRADELIVDHQPWTSNLECGNCLAGPTVYGFRHEFCTDCLGCHAFWCRRGNRSVEYLPVEYAKDTSLQTKDDPTTQLVVAGYLRRYPADLCVVNAGIHDTKLAYSTPYVQNVAAYVAALTEAGVAPSHQPGCMRVLWLTTSASLGQHSQNNTRIASWNYQVMANLSRDVDIIDVFAQSAMWPHEDNVHLRGDYYHLLARSIVAGNY
jgi:hypothetical protein